MKKILLVAASAMMVFASCSKVDINYDNDQPQEIALFSVNRNMTKAPVSGTSYPNDYKMEVAAYLAAGGTQAGNFFPLTTFKPTEQGTPPQTYLWTGGRYWPLTDSKINFLAVSQVPESYSGVGSVSVAFNGTNYAQSATVTFTNNQTANDKFNQFDLMYAAGLGNHSSGSRYPEVTMKFEHALAWINFKVAKNDIPAKVTINSIKLNGANYGGTLTLENSKFNSTETYETSGAITPEWSDRTAAVNDVLVPNDKGDAVAGQLVLTKDHQSFGNGLMVVPNKYTSTPYPSFTINYTIDQDGSDATPEDVTTYDYTHTFASTGEGGFEWAIKKKYTYNITINFEEIKVNPSVIDWNSDSGNTSNVPLG